MKNGLTIAGSDCGGGAGIQADLKTMCALGIYGMSVVTAVTVQNTRRVYGVHELPPSVVAGQIDAVFTDIPVHAVKVGMVLTGGTIRVIRERLCANQAVNIVVDPVMVSKSGYRLLQPEAERSIAELVAAADLVTPNLPEAERLTGMMVRTPEDMCKAAELIRKMGAKSVLVKGGHLDSDPIDLLLTDEGPIFLQSKRIPVKNTHGTGCTLSAAIACGLAKGKPLAVAVAEAKDYVTRAILDSLEIGGGPGPLGHMTELYRRAEQSHRKGDRDE